VARVRDEEEVAVDRLGQAVDHRIVDHHPVVARDGRVLGLTGVELRHVVRGE
jgi:hypothetical protein